VRWVVALVALAACRSSDAPPEPKPAPRSTDELDERMRHCPLALDGVASTLEDIPAGVRFVVVAPDAVLADARRRAHHIVEFAARRTREGHGGFDAKGGGRMKNCPVVTDGVVIATTDIAGGVQLDVTTDAAHVAQLRTDSRDRAAKFPFTGATIAMPAR
jgi:hypothetical protein